MAANDKPSERIKKGIAAFAGIAARVAELEDELRDSEKAHSEAEGFVAELQYELENAHELEGLVERLEDVRRGVRTLDELFEEFCNPMLSMAA